jgi:hypothetical protein
MLMGQTISNQYQQLNADESRHNTDLSNYNKAIELKNKNSNSNSNSNDTPLQRYLKRRFPHIGATLLCFDTIEEVETKILVQASKIYNPYSRLTAFRQMGQQCIRYCDFFDALNENVSNNYQITERDTIYDINVCKYVEFENYTSYNEKTNENRLRESYKKRNANLPWELRASLMLEPEKNIIKCQECWARLRRNGYKDDEICTNNVINVRYSFHVPMPEHLITSENIPRSVHIIDTKNQRYCKNCIPSDEQLYLECEKATPDIIKAKLDEQLKWIFRPSPFFKSDEKKVFTPTVIKSNMVLTEPLNDVLRKRFPKMNYPLLCFRNVQEIETKILIQADTILIKFRGDITVNKHPDLDHIRYCDVFDAFAFYNLDSYDCIKDIHVINSVEYRDFGPCQNIFFQKQWIGRIRYDHVDMGDGMYRNCKCDGCGKKEFDNELDIERQFREPIPTEILDFNVPIPYGLNLYQDKYELKYCNECMPSNEMIPKRCEELKVGTIAKLNPHIYADFKNGLKRICVCGDNDTNLRQCKYCKCVKYVEKMKL